MDTFSVLVLICATIFVVFIGTFVVMTRFAFRPREVGPSY